MPATASELSPDHVPEPVELARFLETYAPTLAASFETVADTGAADASPFLSVVVRTQGMRSALLRETLLCLAAQDCPDFEVIVVAHDVPAPRLQLIERDAALFDRVRPGLLRILRATGGTRAVPCNVGIDAARGRYAALLDDDDHVTADWVSTFRDLASRNPGRVVRAYAVARSTRYLTRKGMRVRVASSRPQPTYCAPWSFEDHLRMNGTPLHAFAFPTFAFRDLGIRVDETLGLAEDWDFLIRLAGALGVSDAARVTAVYNVGAGNSAASSVSRAAWREAEDALRERYSTAPRLTTAPSRRPYQLGHVLDSGRDWIRRTARSVVYVQATEGLAGVLRRVPARVTGALRGTQRP